MVLSKEGPVSSNHSSRHIQVDDVIDPSSLAIDDKERFSDALYQLHSRIFDGVTKDRLRNGLEYESTRILQMNGSDTVLHIARK